MYRERLPEKSQLSSGKLSVPDLTGKNDDDVQFLHTFLRFVLSWSQYIFLISIDNAQERAFYEIESSNNNWTLPNSSGNSMLAYMNAFL